MQEFTQYLQTKNLTTITIKHYVLLVKKYIQWSNIPSTNHTKKEVLNYLAYLKNTKNLQTISRYNNLIALQHYFTHLQDQELISNNPTSFIKLRGLKKRKLYYNYNTEELTALANDYYCLEVKPIEQKLKVNPQQYLLQRSYLAKIRNHTMLLICIHQGLHTREIIRLQLTDINLHKATLLVRKGTTRGNKRTLPIQATQISTLMLYINQIRPQLKTTENNPSLFLPIPKKDPKAKKKAQVCFKGLTQKLKQLNPNFKSLKQLRASVITYWIQTQGLRKAQYLAGHKSIHSTEEYTPNILEDLAEDITQYNPF